MSRQKGVEAQRLARSPEDFPRECSRDFAERSRARRPILVRIALVDDFGDVCVPPLGYDHNEAIAYLKLHHPENASFRYHDRLDDRGYLDDEGRFVSQRVVDAALASPSLFDQEAA